MHYMEYINLKAEPFPASADPDLFYPTRQHGRILRMIEYTVTAKNGLSVILGDVGTGKTTLARMLYRNFSAHKQASVHMITDPSFSTPLEMYREVANQFGIAIPNNERGIKETLEKAFTERFGSGEELGILVIDEGQKMQPPILEVVRELLNLETDRFKLLQIIVFAQKEFEITLGMNSAFSGRIGLLQRIERMDFKNALRMVRFRLERTGKDDRAVSLFTTAAIWAIYKKAKGNPRRVVSLCHQLLMRLVLRQKKRVTFWFVRQNTNEIIEGSRSERRPGLIIAIMLILGVGIFGVLQTSIPTKLANTWYTLVSSPSSTTTKQADETPSPSLDNTQQAPDHHSTALPSASPTPPPTPSPSLVQERVATSSSEPATAITIQQSPVPQRVPSVSEVHPTEMAQVPSSDAIAPQGTTPNTSLNTSQVDITTAHDSLPENETASTATPTPEKTYFEHPSELGSLPMGRKAYVSNMIHDIYGRYGSRLHRQVARANPDISDIDRVPAGKEIIFPAISTQEAFIPVNGFFIELAETQDLNSAYTALHRFKKMELPVRMLPYYTPTQGLVFSIILEYAMESAKEAEAVFLKLPTQAQNNAAVMTAFPADAEFYAYWDIVDKKTFDAHKAQ
ncbi:AAA family ATPase [Desulfovibrio inopinatus]|uniref:AAA family ATPase n=1 Tax=Desulfovibrio inopinatus TaxID=102109 RepID=UPI00042239EC|nr:AAA family ATPase [Desulfovibrio inopinatus]